MKIKNSAEKIFITKAYSLCPTVALLIVAIFFLLLGFAQGEVNSYFQKAILVCTQCIGLG